MGHPSQLNSVLRELLRNLGLERRVAECAAIRLWPEAVGEQIAAVTTAVRMHDGILFVKVKSSIWRQELLYYKGHILRRINSAVGEKVVRDIRFE